MTEKSTAGLVAHVRGAAGLPRAAGGTSALPAAERSRLAKLLAMLGDDDAGKSLAAGRAVATLVRQRGISWAKLLAPDPHHREPLHATWRVACEKLLARADDLRPWEKSFIADLPNFRRISTKQRYVLSAIVKRVLGAESAK